MMLFDALKGQKPNKRKVRMGSIAASALLVVGLGAAIPELNSPPQDQATALTEMMASGKRSKEIRPIVEGSDAYLTFSKDIERVSVGNSAVVELQPPKGRELVLKGKTIGRTSLTVWFAGGSTEQFMFSVQRDLSILDAALKGIDPSIMAEFAPDRDAIVLSGSVADGSFAARAEDAALRYLTAGTTKAKDTNEIKNTGQVINLIRVQNMPAALEARLKAELERIGAKSVVVRRLQQGSVSNDREDVFVIEGSVSDLATLQAATQMAARVLPSSEANKGNRDQDTARVVNRMTIAGQSMEIEDVIGRAIKELGCPHVKVRRVVQTQFPGDADILVLEGSVPTQTHLVRAVTLASKVFLQQELVKNKREGKIEIVREFDPSGQTRVTEKQLKLANTSDDIHVVADESGALKRSGQSSASTLTSGIGGILNAGGSQGGSSSSSGTGRLLTNQIDTNIARAKALEMADGRILSFLTVEDLPQVRVDIKLYEINRTALLAWNSEQNAKITDFRQPSAINPRFIQQTNPVTGQITFIEDPTGVDNEDVQSTISFLAGQISNQIRISGNHVDISSLLSLLEKEGIARSLSNPSLTVLSGELAFFGVGGTTPIQNSVTTAFGTGTAGILTSVTERDFGIRLSLRPLVEENDFITMDVIPSVSNPDADLTRQIRESTGAALATTAFSERSMRTSARLRDGETLLIGGLTEHARTDDSSQTPWLHKIPLIGNLFKGFSYANSDRELVIVVNPVIVREAPKEAPMWAFPEGMELTPSTMAHGAKSEPMQEAKGGK